MRLANIGRTAAVVVATTAVVVTAIEPASASAAYAPSGADGIQGNAPSCVRVWVKRGRITQTGWAENQCGYRMNLKIVWAWGANGSCHSVQNGGRIWSRVAIEPRVFDGASRC